MPVRYAVQILIVVTVCLVFLLDNHVVKEMFTDLSMLVS